MEIKSYRYRTEQELLQALRQVRLKGFRQEAVYNFAAMRIERANPEDLAPAQRYVLKDGVERILDLYDSFYARGVDIFSLHGALFFRTEESGEEEIPFLPPIVEQSMEPDGRLLWIINDGMHRIAAARRLRQRINVVTVVGATRPYYAFATPNGWADVTEITELTEDFKKKEYRNPEDYKALFRDFNGVFPGVQKQRELYT